MRLLTLQENFAVSINRTKVELKFEAGFDAGNMMSPINRTKVELKYGTTWNALSGANYQSYQSGIEMNNTLLLSFNSVVYQSYQSGIEIPFLPSSGINQHPAINRTKVELK